MLVSKIVLTPKDGEDSLTIDLYGDLAGILNMAAGSNLALSEEYPIEKILL